MKRKVTYSAAVLLLLVVGVAWAQRTDVSRLFPIYNNGGKPDLTVDPKRFISQMEIVDRFFDSSSCELIEGSIGGTGYRRLLRFDTVLINGGDGDLLVGSPTDPNNPYHSVFVFSPCHNHYHIDGFSNYRLLNLNHTVVALGHKQAFCLEDLLNQRGGYIRGRERQVSRRDRDDDSCPRPAEQGDRGQFPGARGSVSFPYFTPFR